MAANMTLQRDAAEGAALDPVHHRALLSGMGNMMRKELGAWFHTRRWLWQLLLWVGGLNGYLAVVLLSQGKLQLETGALAVPGMDTPYATALLSFFALIGLFGPTGVIQLMMDSVLGEKQSGTAAWVLSKPLSRPAFILSKLFANAFGFGLFMLTIPGAVAYGEVSLAAGHPLAVLPFVAGLGLIGLQLLFFLTLLLLLGVLFDQRPPMLTVAMVVWLGIGLGGRLAGAGAELLAGGPAPDGRGGSARPHAADGPGRADPGDPGLVRSLHRRGPAAIHAPGALSGPGQQACREIPARLLPGSSKEKGRHGYGQVDNAKAQLLPDPRTRRTQWAMVHLV